MAKNAPKGDKTTKMNDKMITKDGRGKQGKCDITDSEVSFDTSTFDDNDFPCYDPDFDLAANFELLRKHFQRQFDRKFILMQTEFNGKIDALHEVIKNKDETIGKLHTQIGELKKSCDFLSQETTVLESKIIENGSKITSSAKSHNELANKTADLEDRSRRNNVVFYNIPEENDEDCEVIILNLLKSRGFFEHDYTLEIDRAHRLGRKRDNSDVRPRPLIVRFSFFKDKDVVIKKGRLFKGSEVNASEDFSKATLDIHKTLRIHAREAKNFLDSDSSQTMAIVHYKVMYRRIAITYRQKDSNQSTPSLTRTFTPQYIESNKKWFLPPKRNTYNNVQQNVN